MQIELIDIHRGYSISGPQTPNNFPIEHCQNNVEKNYYKFSFMTKI